MLSSWPAVVSSSSISLLKWIHLSFISQGFTFVFIICYATLPAQKQRPSNDLIRNSGSLCDLRMLFDLRGFLHFADHLLKTASSYSALLALRDSLSVFSSTWFNLGWRYTRNTKVAFNVLGTPIYDPIHRRHRHRHHPRSALRGYLCTLMITASKLWAR